MLLLWCREQEEATGKCDTCGCLFHLSCVGLTRAQAEAFGRWNCEQCRGVARVPAKAETPPIDLVGYIVRCHHILRVLNRIPKGAVIPVADALQRLIREALDRGNEIAWGRLLSFSYWGLGCPGESGGVRQVLLSTLVRQQVSRFMEGTDLPAVKVTTRRRDGVCGGDKTLKRRVAAEFAEGDVSGAVRELASAEGLAPQDADTLRALKEKPPSAPENLSLPDPPDGFVVPALPRRKMLERKSCLFRAGASGGADGLRPGHLRSLVAHGSAEAGSRLLFTLTDLVNVMLRGEVPQFAVPILYGANECAIRKKDGGIWPIAVGSSLRRLSVKVGSRPIVQAFGEELRPVQLGSQLVGDARRQIMWPDAMPGIVATEGSF